MESGKRAIAPELFLLLACMGAMLCAPAHAFSASRAFGGGSSTNCVNNGSFVSLPSQISVSFWINLAATDATSRRAFEYGGGSAGNPTNVQVTSTNFLFQAGWTTSGNFTIATPSTGVWHNIVIVYSFSSTSNLPTIYLDGASQSVTRTQTPSGSAQLSGNTWTIGNSQGCSSSFKRPINGSIAEAALWNVALGAGEIKSLSRGTPASKVRPGSLVVYWPLYGVSSTEDDLSGNRRNGTVSGAAAANHCPCGR